MKPSKTAYKRPAKRGDGGNPMIDKLLKLKYRLNDAYNLRDIDTKDEKLWVMGQISALREGARLDTHQMKHANQLWRAYST